MQRDLMITLGVILWIVAMSKLLGRKDIDVHDKIKWVVILIILNVIGAALYFIIGPKSTAHRPNDHPDEILGPNAKEIHVNNSAWNPITGQNNWGPGKGLNPKVNEDDEIIDIDVVGKEDSSESVVGAKHVVPRKI